MADIGYKQDMPPPGGYKAIQYKRVPLRPFINGKLAILGYVGITALGSYWVYKEKRRIRRRDVEEYDSNIAIEPILSAERDREYLKQLIRNREAERELMKDVPGWKPGTYNGEPLFKTCDEDFFVAPSWNEYFTHTHRGNRDYSRMFFYYKY